MNKDIQIILILIAVIITILCLFIIYKLLKKWLDYEFYLRHWFLSLCFISCVFGFSYGFLSRNTVTLHFVEPNGSRVTRQIWGSYMTSGQGRIYPKDVNKSGGKMYYNNTGRDLIKYKLLWDKESGSRYSGEMDTIKNGTIFFLNDVLDLRDISWFKEELKPHYKRRSSNYNSASATVIRYL